MSDGNKRGRDWHPRSHYEIASRLAYNMRADELLGTLGVLRKQIAEGRFDADSVPKVQELIERGREALFRDPEELNLEELAEIYGDKGSMYRELRDIEEFGLEGPPEDVQAARDLQPGVEPPVEPPADEPIGTPAVPAEGEEAYYDDLEALAEEALASTEHLVAPAVASDVEELELAAEAEVADAPDVEAEPPAEPEVDRALQGPMEEVVCWGTDQGFIDPPAGDGPAEPGVAEEPTEPNAETPAKPEVAEGPAEVETEVAEEPAESPAETPAEPEVAEEPADTEPEEAGTVVGMVGVELIETEVTMVEVDAPAEPEVAEEPADTEPEVAEEPADTEPEVAEEPADTEPEVAEEPADTEPDVAEEPAEAFNAADEPDEFDPFD